MPFSHFALVVVSAVAHSIVPSSGAGDEWNSLDSELAKLALAAPGTPAAPEIHGWIRTRGAFSSDVDAAPATTGSQDLGGFNLDSARVVITSAPAEGYGLTLSLEAGDPLVSDTNGAGVGLLDAYATVPIGNWASASVGRFSATFLWRTSIDERKLVFLDRTFLGEAWDGRDVGVEFSGQLGQFNWWAAAQNGLDGAAKDVALSACGCFQFLENSLHYEESNVGIGDHEYLTASATWFDDTSVDGGTAIGGGLYYTRGPWSATGEIVDFGDDIQPLPAVNPATGAIVPTVASPLGAETSWSGMVGYMLVPDRWELNARWQDIDDTAKTTVLSLAVNWYVAGQDAKWTLQLDQSKSDDPTLEVTVVAVGLTVGF